LAIDDCRQPFLPTLYYIPNEKTIADENKELVKDEVDWPELAEHRRQIDEELAQVKAADKPDLVQVWFTGEEVSPCLMTQADLPYRRPYQHRWRYR
jgi:hypothetical protein